MTAGRITWRVGASAALVVLVLLACTPNAERTPDQFEAAQQRSHLGPTSEWKLTPGFWSASMQQMRDRAYRHCSEKSADDPTCFDWQDLSLLMTMHIDKDVAAVRAGRNSDLPLFAPSFEQGIRDMPEGFDEARRQCFDVYRDGDGDARALGPCVSAATGRDYFGIVPTP